MKSARRNMQGFVLLELVVVLSVMLTLSSVAIPQYLAYLHRGQAAACAANRHHIELAEEEYFLRHNQAGGGIDLSFKCPSGGEYVWLVSDPAAPGYPRVVCSIHGPAIAPATLPSPKALFSTDFNSLEGMTLLKGKWTVADSALTPSPKGTNVIVFGEPDWSDTETIARITLDSGKGVGIYYRTDGQKKISGYYFQYAPGTGKGVFIVRKVVDGKNQKPIGQIAIPDGYPIYGQAHDVSITADGDHHVIRIDGDTLFDFTDTTFASGGAGLSSWGKADAAFESVTVNPIGQGA